VPWHACNLTLNFDAVQESCGRIQREPYDYMIIYLYIIYLGENFLEKRFITLIQEKREKRIREAKK
jgi:hypothetical protein